MKLEGSYTPIRAVERSLDLLASLNRRPISRVQDLVADTGLPAPTIIRLLETLMATGHVQHHGRRVGYTVTARVAELSAGHHGLPQFLEPARPILTELTQDLLWPAALAVPVGHGGKVAATLGLTFFRGAGAKHQALLDRLHSAALRLEGALT